MRFAEIRDIILTSCRATLGSSGECEVSEKNGVTIIDIKYTKPLVAESITITLQPNAMDEENEKL